MKKRRRSHRNREGERVCCCGSYSFPHRWSGGQCRPQRWVDDFYDPWRGECRECMNRDGAACQVVDRVEETFHCPELRDFVRFESIKLYGVAREQFERTQHRAR